MVSWRRETALTSSSASMRTRARREAISGSLERSFSKRLTPEAKRPVVCM